MTLGNQLAKPLAGESHHQPEHGGHRDADAHPDEAFNVALPPLLLTDQLAFPFPVIVGHVSTPVRQERQGEHAEQQKQIFDFKLHHFAVPSPAASLRQCRTETDRHCRPFSRSGKREPVSYGAEFYASSYRGVSSCVQSRASWPFAPQNLRDRKIPAGTKLSRENSAVLPSTYGRSKRRLNWHTSQRLTSARRNAGCAANTNRRSRSSSLSFTKCSESKPISICDSPRSGRAITPISNLMKGWGSEGPGRGRLALEVSLKGSIRS